MPLYKEFPLLFEDAHLYRDLYSSITLGYFLEEEESTFPKDTPVDGESPAQRLHRALLEAIANGPRIYKRTRTYADLYNGRKMSITHTMNNVQEFGSCSVSFRDGSDVELSLTNTESLPGLAPIQVRFAQQSRKMTVAGYTDTANLQYLKINAAFPSELHSERKISPDPILEIYLQPEPCIDVYATIASLDPLHPMKIPFSMAELISKEKMKYIVQRETEGSDYSYELSIEGDLLMVEVFHQSGLRKIVSCPLGLGNVDLGELFQYNPATYFNLPLHRFSTQVFRSDGTRI